MRVPVFRGSGVVEWHTVESPAPPVIEIARPQSGDPSWYLGFTPDLPPPERYERWTLRVRPGVELLFYADDLPRPLEKAVANAYRDAGEGPWGKDPWRASFNS